MYEEETMTLQEIADELGLTKQMVAKIERRAIDKAGAILAEQGLTFEDFLDEIRQQEAYAEAQESGGEVFTHNTPWTDF